MGHVPMQVIKDALPLLKNGGPAMVENAVKNLIKKISPTDGTAISGRVVLITGGSSSLGRLIAEECARRGAKAVIIWDDNQDSLDETVARLTKMRCKAAGYLVDISDTQAVDDIARQVLEEFEDVDILIHAARAIPTSASSYLASAPLTSGPHADSTGLSSVTQAFLPHMLDRDHGHIVSLSSVSAVNGPISQEDYAGEKHEPRSFMRSLRSDLVSKGSAVKTLTVCSYYASNKQSTAEKWASSILHTPTEEEISDKVIASIESGQQELFIPESLKYSAILYKLPAHWYDAIMSILGIK